MPRIGQRAPWLASGSGASAPRRAVCNPWRGFAQTLQCQLFSTASELYDAGAPPQTLQQLIDLNDKQTPMNRSSKTVLEILKHSHLKTEKNIKLM